MFKRILVPTDGSEYSRHALSTAILFAKQFDSEIVLLHVVSQPRAYGTFTGGFNIDFSEEQIEKIGEEVFNVTLEGIDTCHVRIYKRIATDHPATVILDEIKLGIDIVVMGSRGHGPFAGAITGSVTQRVLAHAPCPVVVVK